MSNYHLWTLVLSGFTAIGTCGATIFALYFWLNDQKIRLSIRAMQANTYGNFLTVEGGYFVAVLTNRSFFPLTVEFAGLKVYQKKWFKQKVIGFSIFENTKFDVLPKKIGFGESYRYIMPINDIRVNLENFKKLNNIDDIKIHVGISIAKRDIDFKLDEGLKKILLS